MTMVDEGVAVSGPHRGALMVAIENEDLAVTLELLKHPPTRAFAVELAKPGKVSRRKFAMLAARAFGKAEPLLEILYEAAH